MSTERLHSSVTLKADGKERYQDKCRILEEEVQHLRYQVQCLSGQGKPSDEETTSDTPKESAEYKSFKFLCLENQSLTSEVEDLRNHVADLEGEISEFDEENTTLQQENEQLHSRILKLTMTSEKLEELQNLIKELNENWMTALGREKVLADQLFFVKEDRDRLYECCGMLSEDLAAEQAKTTKFAQVRSELSALQEEVKEIPRLKVEYKKLTAENMKMQRYTKQKSVESEKLQEDLFVLSRKVEYMREMVTATQSGGRDPSQNIEKAASSRADFDLLTQKYDKVKKKYHDMRDQLALCNSRMRFFETSLEKVTQQQAALGQKLTSLSENSGSLSTISDELEDTSVTIGTLMERLQSKSFFSMAVAEELRVISIEEEEAHNKVKLDKVVLEVKVSELEAEIHSLKSSLSAAQGRIETLEKVEKLVHRHFPRAKDITEILSQVLANREEEQKTRAQFASKPISPRIGGALRDEIGARSTISLNSSGHNLQPVGGVKAAALVSSLKELEAEPKKKTFGGLFKLG